MPVTGYGEVDFVVTEYAIFKFDDNKMVLKAIAPEISVEELKEITEAKYSVADDLKTMIE